ncbi:hypothetical protein ACSBL2_10425 [Pedobacter sp. AW31-3R]|uniref:hypothetical protein n=1 Tax=Pedobacter sp. AW31-3R TaxID=3445781 RepID=UPI003FA0B028
MGYIKEPKGIDFIVAPSVLTADDRTEISECIAKYKKGKSKIAVLAEPKYNMKLEKSTGDIKNTTVSKGKKE